MWLFDLFKKRNKEETSQHKLLQEFYDSVDVTKKTVLCSNKNQYKKDYENDSSKYIKKFNLDFSKDSILIIDDNAGVVSFLVDDLIELNKEEKINLQNYNIIKIDSQFAAFILEASLLKYKDLNIKYAIIDITLGGSIKTTNGVVKYNGVDVFKMLYDIHPDLKFIFYTGNNLNTYISANNELIKKFKNIYGDSIDNYIIHKSELNMDERQKEIITRLFTSSI